jgi:hypothetical protein
VRNTWNRATENLYSAWIEKRFDAPLDTEPSWRALHEVLRERTGNFPFNHLGRREDQTGLIIRPDCGDLPYLLRAYFAFKGGGPFGYSTCWRGDGGQPPAAEVLRVVEHSEARTSEPAPFRGCAAVYADRYGHVLVLARRIPQSDGGAGVILAVDAQPDGTVARKRFWRGNFLFAQAPALGSPGSSAFGRSCARRTAHCVG